MPAFHITAASTAASLPYVTAGAAALALLLVAKSVMVPGPSPPSARAKHVLLSPRTTLLPKLSSDEAAALPYPPDVLPGARDVETPYGSLRVYEWGPIEGDKVLLVHGISTPCVALAPLAEELVKRGRRVMLFGKSRSLFFFTSTLFGKKWKWHIPKVSPKKKKIEALSSISCLLCGYLSPVSL